MSHAASSTIPWGRCAAIALVLAGLLATGRAHAEIETILDTLSMCEPGGGIGVQIGNVGTQDTPQDTGFQFTVPLGMGGAVTELTVCVSTGDTAYVAPFAIFTDAAGVPGEAIDTFDVPIPESRAYASSAADTGALLLPGIRYWVVAERSAERGTWWETVPTEPGVRARLQPGDTEWTIDETGITQMRIRVLPEPAGAAGTAAVALAIVAWRRARS